MVCPAENTASLAGAWPPGETLMRLIQNILACPGGTRMRKEGKLLGRQVQNLKRHQKLGHRDNLFFSLSFFIKMEITYHKTRPSRVSSSGGFCGITSLCNHHQ